MDAIRLLTWSRSFWQKCRGGGRVVWPGLMAVLLLLRTAGAARAAEPVESVSEQEAEDANLAQGLTLSHLSARAQGCNPRLREALAEINVFRGRAHQALLYPNPTLSGGTMQLGGRDSQYYGQVSQELVTKHKLNLDGAAACREVYQSELWFLRTRFELLTAVRRDYFAVLTLQRRVIVLDRLISLSSDVVKTGEQLERAGEGTRGDTLLFEIELEKAEVTRTNAIAELRAARRQLATDLGLHDDPLLVVNGNLLEEPTAVLPIVEAAGYVPRNADVQIAEFEVDRSRYLLQRAEVQPFPNVTINAGYMRQVVSPYNMAILQVEVPVPLWNKNQGNICAAQAAVARSQQAVARTQLDISRQMADAIGRFQQSQQQVERYRDRIVPKAKEGVEIVRSGIAGGQLELVRLLQAQRALIDASLMYLTALDTRWKAAAEIAGMVQLEQFP
jgi:cobalt-zinc-cadmium efflux system outer membrane protein